MGWIWLDIGGLMPLAWRSVALGLWVGLAHGAVAMAQASDPAAAVAEAAPVDAAPVDAPSDPPAEAASAEAAPVDGVPPVQPASTSEPAGSTSVGQLNRSLYTVEQSVNNLKETVFRSKSTLQLLKELIIDSATKGSRVSVVHINKLPTTYRIESIQYFIDNKLVFSRADLEKGLGNLSDLEVVSGALPPGEHTLQVHMGLRGNGMRFFSYLNGYEFQLQSTYPFEVVEQNLTSIKVTIRAKSSFLYDYKNRPTINYRSQLDALRVP